MAGQLQPPIPTPTTGGNQQGNHRGYHERKEEGICTRCGKEPALEDSLLGERCLRSERRRVSRAVRRLRRRRRDEGRCRSCPAESETARCPACNIKQGRIPTTGGNRSGNQQADGTGGVWRDDANGWRRFRGRGKRGAPPAGANDAFELKTILDAIARGKEALAYARSPEVAQMGRITQQAAKNEVAALFAHAARGLDDLVDRMRNGR